MLAIYKREFKSYFQNVIGFLFIAATLFLVGIYFSLYNLMYGYPYVSYALSGIVFVFLITVPVLTMKVLSEERRQKSDQLILTAPISVWKIVTGKYLALISIFAIPTLIISLYPLILTKFGSVPLGENYTGIFGFFLYGCASIAIALFISSITENQVIAAVVSFAALFICYMMSGIESLISSSGNLLTKIMNVFDLSTPFQTFVNGTLDITAIVYFLTVIILMLFFTVQSIQKRRFSFSTKNLTMGAYSSTMIVIAIVVALFVNLAVNQIPVSITAIDVTEDDLHSITDITKGVLDNLTEDITIYTIAVENDMDENFLSTIKLMEDYSDHVNVVYVDPAVSPNFYTEYTDSISSGSVIVVSDERSTVVDIDDIYTSELNYSTYSYDVTGYDGEGLLTSAITYVTSDDMPKAYILEGHDEYELEDEFTGALSKENIETETINLLQYDAVPDDCAFLIINAPAEDYSEDDAQKVIDYLEAGGNLLMTFTYTGTDFPNFESILEAYQISLVDGMIIETDKNYYYQNPFYLLPNVESDTVTSGIAGSYYIFAPYAVGINIPEETTDDYTVTSLLTTSDEAFSKINVNEMTSYDKELGDIDGPFSIAVKVTKTIDDTDSYIYFLSSGSIFTSAANETVSGSNLALFTNIVSSMVDEDTTSAVPVKSYSTEYLTISQADIITLAVLVTIVMPIVIILCGIIIWVRRRRR